MMKVVHVFTAPQSAYFFMEGQLNFLVSKGVDITVIMPPDDVFNQRFKDINPQIKIINVGIKRKLSPLYDLLSLYKLSLAFRKLRPDIIHLHTPKASLLGGLAGRITKCRVLIYQMHGLVSAEGNHLRRGLIYQFEKVTCRLATEVIAVSKSLRDFAIANKYCRRDKITVLNNGTINGIDAENRFDPEKVQIEDKIASLKNAGYFIIGFVGRINLDKGFEDFLFVVSGLRTKGIKFKAIVVGPDEDPDTTKDLLSKFDLEESDNIIFFGQQFHPEKFMIGFDILVLPTKREGFGLVAAEANALLVPVVGYDIPGFRDAVVNGSTGTLVPYSDHDLLLSAVMRYYDDRSLVEQQGQAGRARVLRDFVRQDLWEALLNEYKRLLLDREG